MHRREEATGVNEMWYIPLWRRYFHIARHRKGIFRRGWEELAYIGMRASLGI